MDLSIRRLKTGNGEPPPKTKPNREVPPAEQDDDVPAQTTPVEPK
jgi:hypothetical protein